MKCTTHPAAAAFVLAVGVTTIAPHLPAQMRAAASVALGGVISVDVGSNAASVQVSDGGPATSSHPVPPSKRVDIPVPAVPPGTVLMISVGRGLRRQVLLVEVIAP